MSNLGFDTATSRMVSRDLATTLKNNIFDNISYLKLQWQTRFAVTLLPSFGSRKLDQLGIRNNFNNWLTSIINGKQFKVKIANRYSDTFISEMGTPQ